MASEVTSNKPQAARPSLSDSLSVKKPEKALATSQGSKSGQDFLAALDKAADPKNDLPKKIADQTKPIETPRRTPKAEGKPQAKANRDLSRVKPPKLTASNENPVDEARAGDAPVRDEATGRFASQEGAKKVAQQTAGDEQQPAARDAKKAYRDAMESAPVVAFLTGHLEKLDMSQIPSLVAGNDFVQNALSEPDIEQFMQQPMKVSELLASLGLPKHLMNQATVAGLDLDQVITPQSFFKDLGIDPQRVSVELQLLRDNLALGGVSMYMGRAQSLRSPEDLGSASTPSVSGRPGGVDPQAQMRQSKVSPTFTGLGNIMAPALGSVSAPQEKQANLRVSLDQGMEQPSLAVLEDGLLEESTLEQGPQSLAYVLAAQDWLRSAAGSAKVMPAGEGGDVSNLDPRSIRPDLGASIREELGLTANRLSQTPNPNENVSGPTTHGATFDAWRTLGDTLKGVDTETLVVDLDSQDPQVVRSTLGNLAEEPLAVGQKTNRQLNTDVILRAPWVVAQEALLKGASGELSDVAATPGSVWSFNPASPSNPASVTGALGAKVPMALDLNNKLPDPSAMLFDRGSDIFSASLQAGLETSSRGRGDQSFGSEQQGDQGSDKGGTRSVAIETLSVRPASLDKSSFDPISPTFSNGVAQPSGESSMTPSQRAHLVQQVIDRTTMLSSQGGGTVRLDLSSADLGRMEVAVAMDEGRVNLRVLTGSDGMRSAILTDMTRLKEALGQQNIQLGLVEVGVAGQQTSSGGQGFAGQGSFDQRRDFSREDFARTVAQTIGSRGVSQASVAEVGSNSPLAPADTLIGSGRIALRI